MTEKIINDFFENEKMTGHENYDIIGSILNKEQTSFLMQACSGCILTADCIKKAYITQKTLLIKRKEFWKMILGSIKVFSKDMKSIYSHEFNPPNELHCWLENEKKEIIDIALPGVIIRGLRAKDEFGSFLEGRVPTILAGESLDWIIYNNRKELII